MAYRWTVNFDRAGKYTLNVCRSGQIYHGTDESHVHALERVLSDIASARALELDNLYESVVKVEQEQASFKRFKTVLDQAWNKFVLDNSVIVLQKTNDALELNKPNVALCQVMLEQAETVQYQGVVATPGPPSRPTTAGAFVNMTE